MADANPSGIPNSSPNGQDGLDGSVDWLERAIAELAEWRGGRACRDGKLDRVVAGALMRAYNDAIDLAAKACRQIPNATPSEARLLAEASSRIMRLGAQEF